MAQHMPPGWYPNPDRTPSLRWWDGRSWTQYTRAQEPAWQTPGGADPFAHHAAHGAPARRWPGWAIVTAVAVAVTLVAVVSIVGVLMSRGSQTIATPDQTSAPVTTASPTADPTPAPTADPTPSPTADPTASAQVYFIQDRPGYAEMETYIVDMLEHYRAARDDGSIFEHVADTDEGRGYVQDFLFLLTDQRSALYFLPGATSTNPGELDALIEGRRERVAELERQFLANEDFGVSIRITRLDGSVYESDGSAPSVDDPEEMAQSFQTAPDAEGSYIPAAEELAQAFGMELNAAWSDLDLGCAGHDLDPEVVAAAYCQATPTVIYINEDHPEFPEMYSTPFFVELIRHEIGHHRIAQICGVTHPLIAGGLSEGVTSSYAVQYLGASREELARMAEADPQYAMTDETDEIARLIHEERRCT